MLDVDQRRCGDVTGPKWRSMKSWRKRLVQLSDERFFDSMRMQGAIVDQCWFPTILQDCLLLIVKLFWLENLNWMVTNSVLNRFVMKFSSSNEQETGRIHTPAGDRHFSISSIEFYTLF